MKRGLCIVKSFGDMTESVRLAHDAHFDAVSLNAGKDIDLTPVAEEARRLNLEIQSLHARYGKVHLMWSEDAALPMNDLRSAIDECRALGIDTIVTHVWIGFGMPYVPNDYGLRNYDIIVNEAQKYGIKIAFENTEGIEYLRALMAHFKDCPSVGFCWDSGHEMCYNRSVDLLSEFGDRLLVTHLNDNLGISRPDGTIYKDDDLHLLPYDGIADWDKIAERLKKAKTPEILNFELKLGNAFGRHEGDGYLLMPKERYFAEIYNRAFRLAGKINA